jgi:1-phosphofructokinase
MILTITPAPAIDLTLEVDSLHLGQVNRSLGSTREASGKGVNVSWALHKAGLPTLALFPAGGSGALVMRSELEAAGLPHRIVPILAELRTNVTVRPSSGHETKINSPGSPLTDSEQGALLDAVAEELTHARAVVISGSGPSGAPATLHADIVSRARRAGVRTFVDTSGPALTHCLDAQPDVITPNIHELAEITSSALNTMSDVIDACQAIRDRGVGMVVVSMGEHGALLVAKETVLWGRAEGVQLVNTVGAGDALLAGLVSAGDDPGEMLHAGVWWASSAVESPSTLFELNPALRARVSVSEDVPLTIRVNENSPKRNPR